MTGLLDTCSKEEHSRLWVWGHGNSTASCGVFHRSDVVPGFHLGLTLSSIPRTNFQVQAKKAVPE